MRTVGEALIDHLEAHGVELVFGIPGVHTAELYRGLAGSSIRHVTPRHEQGAGFMADGYARLSGKPGVAFVITGPGLTNILTPMAQAAADSIPMLVISGVNPRDTLGQRRGLLHELPDQRATAASVALWSHTLGDPDELGPVIDRAFALLGSGRPGPVHIEVPLDVMTLESRQPVRRPAAVAPPVPDAAALAAAVAMLDASRHPLLLVGGGSSRADAEVTALAEALDAPALLTANARGLLAGHDLRVPASPSLPCLRAMIAEADLVLALGTELGQTDYDIYADGGFPAIRRLIRVDVDADQLARHPVDLAIRATVANAAAGLASAIRPRRRDGAARAAAARCAAWDQLAPRMQREVLMLDMIRAAAPGCVIVGDSTQPVYAGNLFCDVDRPRGWFNAATGFGALGYGPPAAVGASLAEPDTPVICLVGDGGLQFSLAEIGSAVDVAANVTFLVWNNEGYGEIESYMRAHGITPEGVTPSAPNFAMIAQAYGIEARQLASLADLASTLRTMARQRGPGLIEIHQTRTAGAET